LPHVKAGEVNLYYEVYGEGEPLLLIEGLGYATWMWFNQVPELSRHFRVIVFDNRGVGESDKPDVPYSISMMAGDTAELLKALGISEAFVLGTSMGGMIAQQLAYDYPWMVKGLVLCCTTFGGPNSIPAPAETVKAMTEIEGLSPEEALRQSMSVAFAPGYPENHKEEFDRVIGWRLENPTPLYAWQHQFNAVMGFNSEDWVEQIQAPTLLLTGDSDRVIPPQNSRMLHEKLPHSRLVNVEGGGHLFFMEQPERVNREIVDFLKEITK